jgi:hypothetical protein
MVASESPASIRSEYPIQQALYFLGCVMACQLNGFPGAGGHDRLHANGPGFEQARVLALCAILLAEMGLDASEPIAVAIEPSLNRRFDHLD